MVRAGLDIRQRDRVQMVLLPGVVFIPLILLDGFNVLSLRPWPYQIYPYALTETGGATEHDPEPDSMVDHSTVPVVLANFKANEGFDGGRFTEKTTATRPRTRYEDELSSFARTHFPFVHVTFEKMYRRILLIRRNYREKNLRDKRKSSSK